jgi:hypothetical protein
MIFAGLVLLAACKEEPTIVIKFEPADMYGRGDGGRKLADMAAPRDLAVAVVPGPACKVAADCAAVPKECCDCNHGGALVVGDKKMAAAAKKSCKDTVCTAMMSNDPSCGMHADCVAGHCALVAGEAPKADGKKKQK